MFPQTRVVLMGVCIAALVTACSKSLSPGTSLEAAGEPDAAEGFAWQIDGTPQTARARLRFIGDIVELHPDFSTQLRRNVEFFVDADELLGSIGGVPPDTVPPNAVLKQVRWRVEGENGPRFVVDNHPEVRFDTGPFAPPPTEGFRPGTIVFRLRVPERAGGGTLTSWLQSGFPPAPWWAGPDPSRFPPASDGDGRAVDVTDWATFTTSPAWPPDGRGYFGPDSFQFVPHERLPVNREIESRTFYEIWGDRIYARSEGDVVHLGAWVVFVHGGFDPDSPYRVPVSPGAPTLPPGYESQPDLYSVLIEQGLIGSPVGFRLHLPVRLPNGLLTVPSETTTHPNFDIFSVLYYPIVASYWQASIPGKGYATGLPVDGHGLVGRTLENMVALADRVDAGGGTAEDRALRRRVITFQVSEAGAPAGPPEAGTSAAVRRPTRPR